MKKRLLFALLALVMCSTFAYAGAAFEDDFSDSSLGNWQQTWQYYPTYAPNPVIWILSADGGEVTPEEDHISHPVLSGHIAHTFGPLTATEIAFEATVRLDGNSPGDRSDYVVIKLGSTDILNNSYYAIDYGIRAGSDDQILFRFNRRTDVFNGTSWSTPDYAYLFQTAVPFDTDYHTIRAERDIYGYWGLFVDDVLIGAVFDDQYTSFGSVTVGANNRGGYISSVMVEDSYGDPIETCDGYPRNVLETFQVDQNPSDIAVLPDESWAYTAGSTGDHYISAVNLSDGTASKITVGNTPWGVAATPDGQLVYVSNYYDNTVNVIDTSTNTVIDTLPVGDGPIWLTATNFYIYVSNYDAGSVSVIRRWDNHVFDPIPVGVKPQSILVTPDMSRVYVANRGGESVSVIDASTLTVLKNITVTGEPAYLAIHPDGSKVYVSQHLLDQVSVIDTNSMEIVGAPIEVGFRPVWVKVTPNGQYLFVMRHYADEIDVVDTETQSIVDIISVGDGPYSMAFSEDGCRLYVPNNHDGRLMVLGEINQPPIADAGDDLTIFAREVAETTVTGNGWDEDGDNLDCRWLQSGNVLVDWAPVGVNGECPLDLYVFQPDVGEHILTMELSDGSDVSTDSMLLMVEPNTAVGFGRHVKVKWDKNEVDIKGNFVLPDGMFMEHFSTDGSAVVSLAGIQLPPQAVIFNPDDKKPDKWQYKANDNLLGSITKFEVDWKGQNFKYKDPEKIELKTEFIGADNTVLKVKAGKIKGDFTVYIGDTTLTFVYDEASKRFNITADGATILEEKKKEGTFALPFALTPDMTFEITGTVNHTVPVVDYFEEGSSAFKLKISFDPADFNGTDTLPDVVEFTITIGSDVQVLFSDVIGVEPKPWTKTDDRKWEYKR